MTHTTKRNIHTYAGLDDAHTVAVFTPAEGFSEDSIQDTGLRFKDGQLTASVLSLSALQHDGTFCTAQRGEFALARKDAKEAQLG